jgi:hypothetical protein
VKIAELSSSGNMLCNLQYCELKKPLFFIIRKEEKFYKNVAAATKNEQMKRVLKA